MTKEEFWGTIHKKSNKDKTPSPFAIESEQMFPPNSLVLEIGGGTSVDSIYFLEKDHRVIMVDISKEALSFADSAAKTKNLKFEELIPLEIGENLIPIPNNTINIIYSRLALGYFTIEDSIKIFTNLYELLTEDGLALIAVNSPDDTGEMEFYKESTEEIEPGVFNEEGILKTRFTKEQWEEILDQAGIKNYEVDSIKESISGVEEIKPGAAALELIKIQFTKLKNKN
jgi:ubiquinone/menaquinone biosynthesis C-methylase UbiE